MPRVLWKGAISFGLVHIPVAIYPAAQDESLDFDWLDKRDMAPVGYKRYNKNTGKEVEREDVVKGIKHEDGRYVILSEEEIRAANVKTTQTVEIVAFVAQDAIAPGYFETPYFLSPTGRGEKVYALLRETLKREKKIGIAYVVIQTKQHLAAVIAHGNALYLNTLRWANEMRSMEELNVPEGNAKQAGLREAELKMAAELVKGMSEKWQPEKYKDTFRDDILALVDKKIAKGQAKATTSAAKASDKPSATIIDLTALLKKSLADRGKPAAQKSVSTTGTSTKKKTIVRKSAATGIAKQRKRA